MIYAYIRVSTLEQDLTNQEFGIKQYCKEHNMKVNAWYEEKISGTKEASKRELGSLIKIAKSGDTIITTEISRLGRSVVDVMATMNECKQKGITLIAIKQNFVLDNSLSSLVISTMFSLCAEIERELLSQRVKEGLANRKAKGIKLGRPYGSKNKRSKLEDSKDFIEMCLQNGKSRYFIKKKLKCHEHTLNEFLLKSKLAKKYNIEINS